MKTIKLPTSYMVQMGEAGIWLTNEEWLYTQYIVLLKSTREIASGLNCGKKAVGTALKRFGISLRKYPDTGDTGKLSRASFLCQANPTAIGKIDNKDWVFEQFIILNKSKTELSACLGVSTRSVEHWLKRHSLTGSKSIKAAQECCERRYTELNGFTIHSEDACKLRMKGRRGVKIETIKAGIIYCHSSWERVFAEYLDAQQSIIGFDKDAIAIPYEYDNKNYLYYPDFIVRTINHTIIVEIKAERLLTNGRVIAKIEALKKFAEFSGLKWLILSGRTGIDPTLIMEFA